MEVISVVGRAHTDQEIVGEVYSLLYEGYKIFACHSLGQPGIDNKERFLVLITAGENPEFDFDTQTDRLRNSESETDFGVKLFDSLDDALEYAQDAYELPSEKVKAHTEMQELIEEFPVITAAESEQFAVLDAFVKLGRVQVVPAQLDGERAIAIVSVTHGPDELRVTPLAILATDELVQNLKLPGEE